MNRRELISAIATGIAITAGAPVLSACGATKPKAKDGGRMEEIAYGDDPSQFGRLYRPDSEDPLGTVVVIHGGFWKSAYDLSLGDPLAIDLASRGWTAWNLEYRRVGDGGGWPRTFDDIAAGIDMLADIDGLELDAVVTLGHSAGGQLAVWAAGRRTAAVPVTAAISQAGVLDLDAGVRDGLGGGAVESFLGGSTAEFPDRYAFADPTRQIPLDVPVWCVHGIDDGAVPPSQSRNYVARARAQGAEARLIEVTGDHFALIDTESSAWAKTVDIFEVL